MLRIPKSQLAANLELAIHAPVGIRGLNILIHGWLRFHHYSPTYRNTIYNRNWLYLTEVIELSEYAGYNLLTATPPPDN